MQVTGLQESKIPPITMLLGKVLFKRILVIVLKEIQE
jgi:hypothetical protein